VINSVRPTTLCNTAQVSSEKLPTSDQRCKTRKRKRKEEKKRKADVSRSRDAAPTTTTSNLKRQRSTFNSQPLWRGSGTGSMYMYSIQPVPYQCCTLWPLNNYRKQPDSFTILQHGSDSCDASERLCPTPPLLYCRPHCNFPSGSCSSRNPLYITYEIIELCEYFTDEIEYPR